ncbi:AMP-binding protein [Rhodovulum sp. DZ06]|uniref:AMP-binding protein n=1 Tax=Rhodovulum sp. DZ06 TaxID=3425126 RepID=UPI003D334666
MDAAAELHQTATDAALALRALRRYPDRIAFRWDGGEMTYAETEALIAGLQVELKALGVGPEQAVAILSSNRVEAWCTVVATQALGGAVSNLHPMASAEVHEAQIRELSPVVVVADDESHAETAAALAKALPDPAHLLLGGGETSLTARARRHADAQVVNVGTPEMTATLNFTGGATGRPKKVVRTQGGVAAMTLSVLADYDLPKAPRFLAVAPISHVGGTKIVPTLLRGGMVRMVRGFDPARVLELIEAERISVALLAPTMIYALLDHPDVKTRDTSSLELLLYGAAPMSPLRLKQGLDTFGPVFAQFYGQTECYPITFLPPEDHDPERPELLMSCGRPVSQAQVKLLDPEGREVAQGEPGEICVRAPSAMTGYRDRHDENLVALEGGWLHTGDIAVADAEGRLYIVDRKKDMIVSGGFNIYPKEVEDVLYAEESVAMCAVIGVPHDKWGEAVMAYVVPRAGATITAEQVTALVKEHKGAIQAPKAVEIVPDLPLTPLGKIDKVALRKPHWEGRERAVG